MTLSVKKASAELQAVGFNRTGKGDNSSVPLLLKIGLQCPATEILPAMLQNPNLPNLWSNDDDRTLLYLGLGELKSPSKINAVEVMVQHVSLKNCQVHSMQKCKPMAGRMVDLVLKVTVPEPDEHAVTELKQLLKTPIKLDLKGGDLVDQANNAPPANDSGEDEGDAGKQQSMA